MILNAWDDKHIPVSLHFNVAISVSMCHNICGPDVVFLEKVLAECGPIIRVCWSKVNIAWHCSASYRVWKVCVIMWRCAHIACNASRVNRRDTVQSLHSMALQCTTERLKLCAVMWAACHAPRVTRHSGLQGCIDIFAAQLMRSLLSIQVAKET